MGWVRSARYFGDRARCLVIDKRDAIVNVFEKEICEKSDNPEAMCDLLTALIEEYRPELKGGFLIAFHFSPSGYCWEFTYCHPSFPRTAVYEPLVRERLLAEPEPAVVTIP